MEELRLAFLVLGACAIVGILVHGLWSVRKNAAQKDHAQLETREWANDIGEDDEHEEYEQDSDVLVVLPDDKKREPSFGQNDYDDLGLGPVRIVKSDEETDTSEMPVDSTDDLDLSASAAQVSSEKVTQPASRPKIYSSVVTQPKPEYAADQLQAMRSRIASGDKSQLDDIPEPPPFLLKTSTIDTQNSGLKQPSMSAQPAAKIAERQDAPVVQAATEPANSSEAEKISLADQARNFVKRTKTEVKPKKRREPKMREDQMRIDFDEPETGTQQPAGSSGESATKETVGQQEVLVLNVKTAEDKPIQGAALLPMLLTLGFKFGDQDIFHRHVNSNGKGPVLFSLANMFKPGVFDIDNLENFTTRGVSLFMMLPIEGDPHQVFNMMHNAARKIADEFSAQVLDGRRSALTKQSLQQYVEKIREFERKRMIAR